jgi:radical SAM superfamily enzyme YgiQ (UPF0313 family)
MPAAEADAEPNMPGKVLLVSVNRCERPYPVFPLGLAYLDAALQAAGYQTRWRDCQSEPQSLRDLTSSFRPDFVAISLRNIDDVVITRRETYFDPLAALTEEARRAWGVPVVLGGSGFSIFPQALLEMSGADFGIQGEGEVSLPGLLEALANGADYSRIPGLVYRQDGRLRANPTEHLALDTLPPALRPSSLLEYYLRETSMMNVQTQRGCSCHCEYCTYPLIEGSRFRRQPAEAVAEEWAELGRRGAKYLVVVDSIFNSSPEHVQQVCEALLRRGVRLRWMCFLRPAGLTAELARLMARAGLAHVEFGTDSLSDAVLAAYGKRFTVDDVCRSHELMHQANIDCCHFLICGGPGETRDTLAEGFRRSLQLKDAAILALVGMRVYPGTRLHAQLRRVGPMPSDAELLQPYYHLSPALTETEVFRQLQEFSRQSPSWIIGDPPPRYAEVAARLRARGVIGPLWSYWCTAQRLAPALAKYR